MTNYADMKVKGMLLDDEDFGYILHWCPGCKSHHSMNVRNEEGPRWYFNGNYEKPTFTPSYITWLGDRNAPTYVCHVFVTDGAIEFLGDCTHELKGQKIAMEPPHI